MKTMILKSALAIILVFAGAMSMNLSAQEKFVTNDEIKDDLVVSKTIYLNDGQLHRHTKYTFKYDDQKRVVEKEVLKWNGSKEEWMQDHRITYTYAADTVTMELARWNKKQKEYNLDKKESVYKIDPETNELASII